MASPCMVFTPSGVHRKRHVVKVSCEMIYTVGHSTRELDDILALMAALGARTVVGVRRNPAYSRHPPLWRRTLSRGADRPSLDVLAVGSRALSSGRPTRTGVVVRIDGSLGGRLDAWVSRLPAPAVMIVGLVMVAGLGWVDFVTGPELTPLVFYLAPVVLVAWYAGRWPGAIIACAGGLAWMLADALTLRDYSHWSIPYGNAVLRLAALVLVSEAVARLRLAHARERELARSDALTGGPNARAFYEVAAAEITRARRYTHPFSVAYLDLDDFKLVNDRLGHLAGDAVLRSVARALSGVLRASDVVARLGGDEFVVLLPEAGAAPARLATEKLRGVLADVVPAHGWRMTASIGVATFLVPPGSVDALLAAVDGLLYRAKQGGKNGVAHEPRNETTALR